MLWRDRLDGLQLNDDFPKANEVRLPFPCPSALSVVKGFYSKSATPGAVVPDTFRFRLTSGLNGIREKTIPCDRMIKNTGGPRERASIVRMAAFMWVAITAFLAALWLTPHLYQPLLWLPYLLLLPLSIRFMNRRQQEIRRDENRRQPTNPEDKPDQREDRPIG